MRLSGKHYTPEASTIFEGPKAPAPPGGATQKRFEWTLPEEALEELVDLIPNPPELNRDEWIRVLHGIAGAGGGFEIWNGWSSKWPGYDAGKTQKAWDTLDVSRVMSGGGLLREMAENADAKGFAAWRQKWEAAAVFPDTPLMADAAAFRLVDPKKFPRRPWLYGRRLMRGYVSATIAAGGVGKSSLVMTEIMSMVSGMELMREKPRAPLRVWLWNGEDDLTELGRRLHGICLRYGINDHDLGDRLYVDSGREKQIVLAAMASRGSGSMLNDKVIGQIKDVIRKRKIDVLVLDPFVSAHMVSENDNMAIDAVAKALARIADECFCAVDIVHHIRKPGNGATGSASVDDARGASALINATRHARVLTPMPPSVAAKLGIKNHRAYFAVQHDATKANMVPPSVGADWYHFENVGLGNEDLNPADGLGREEQDYVGVVERWDPPSTTVSEDPAKARAAQDEIAKGVFRSSEKASDWVGPVIARALGVDMTEDGNRKLVRDTQAIWVRKGWLKVSKRKDATRHEVDFIEVGDRPEIDVFGDDLTN